jgi:predicted XRE-type DNA-binding protein
VHHYVCPNGLVPFRVSVPQKEVFTTFHLCFQLISMLHAADRQNISEQVIAMRSQNPSLSQAEIARQLGINKMRVSRILAREESDENA